MVGGRAFASTCWRLRELNLAEGGAYQDVQGSWQQGRLPDNLPKLIVANVPQIPKEAAQAYRKAMGQAKTGFFDTHPCDRDRIARAREEEPGEGLFPLEGPATDVFRKFDSLARVATLDLYRDRLGPEIGKERLYPIAELMHQMASHGFEPSLRQKGSKGDITLRTCPFATTALADPDTVCELHLGIAYGIADNLEGLVIDELVPKDPRRAGCRLRCHVEAEVVT